MDFKVDFDHHREPGLNLFVLVSIMMMAIIVCFMECFSLACLVTTAIEVVKLCLFKDCFELVLIVDFIVIIGSTT